jgi:hypothetical protein
MSFGAVARVDYLTKLASSIDYIEILAVSRPMTYSIHRTESVESHLGSIQTKHKMPATINPESFVFQFAIQKYRD